MEIYIKCVYYGDIICEISTEKNLYQKKKSQIINFCVLYLGNSQLHFLQYLLPKELQVSTTSYPRYKCIKIKYLS